MYINLQYIGHFKDPNLVDKFKSELDKYGILHEIRQTLTTNEELGLEVPKEVVLAASLSGENYYLFAERSKFPEALQIYQSLLGIGVPPKPNEADEQWMEIKELPVGAVGKFCIILSIIFYVFHDILNYKEFMSLFFFGNPKEGLFQSAIYEGQIWRLLTPMFLHFGIFHIAMNSLWMRELSRILEDYYSRQRFITYLLIISISSNVAQYLMKGPMFGGLSGLVYGLLGVLWVKKSLDQDFPFMLPKRDVYLMMGWFVLCLTGLLGNIANTAHGIGLAMGMLLATLEMVPKILKQHSGKLAILKWMGLTSIVVFLTMLAEVAWSIFHKTPLFYERFF